MNIPPILVVAYNRPDTLLRQLERIEKLAKTEITISIDGERSEHSKKRQSTLQNAERWALQSHHRVEIIDQNRNLGIYDHLPLAVENFFSRNSFGVILEDDIEFVPSFLELVNSYKNKVVSGSFWSICGHNPLLSCNPYSFSSSQVKVLPSNFHSIWGWASSSGNIAEFVNCYRRKLSINEISRVLDTISRTLTNDPLLRRAFVLTWTRKLMGWNARRLKSGWDTRWVFEAWKQKTLSIIPEISLAREEIEQPEGQTHPHATNGELWIPRQEITDQFLLVSRKKSLDISLLETWGIRRKYSWLYWYRITKQLGEVTQ